MGSSASSTLVTSPKDLAVTQAPSQRLMAPRQCQKRLERSFLLEALQIRPPPMSLKITGVGAALKPEVLKGSTYLLGFGATEPNLATTYINESKVPVDPSIGRQTGETLSIHSIARSVPRVDSADRRGPHGCRR